MTSGACSVCGGGDPNEGGWTPAGGDDPTQAVCPQCFDAAQMIKVSRPDLGPLAGDDIAAGFLADAAWRLRHGYPLRPGQALTLLVAQLCDDAAQALHPGVRSAYDRSVDG